jgi:hypothetical protein
MNILLAGFAETRHIPEGINYLYENGISCRQSEDADEIIHLLEEEIFDIIIIHMSFGPDGLRFRSRFPGTWNFDCISPEKFYDILNQYAEKHGTKLVSAWMHEKWPTPSGWGSSGLNWVDSIVSPDSAIEIITTLQRVLQQYPGIDQDYRRFFQASSILRSNLWESEYSITEFTIKEVLLGTDIRFNRRLIRVDSEISFPLALTAWSRNEETFYYYTPLRYSSIPIITTKVLPFIEDAEWVRADALDTQT